MEFKYLMPTEIYFGEDEVLKNKGVFDVIGNKALIVTGRSSAKIKIMDPINLFSFL